MRRRNFRYILGNHKDSIPISSLHIYSGYHIGALTSIPGTRYTRFMLPDDMKLNKIENDVCYRTTDTRTLGELEHDILVTTYTGASTVVGDGREASKVSAKHRNKWREMLWRGDPAAYDPTEKWSNGDGRKDYQRDYR